MVEFRQKADRFTAPLDKVSQIIPEQFQQIFADLEQDQPDIEYLKEVFSPQQGGAWTPRFYSNRDIQVSGHRSKKFIEIIQQGSQWVLTMMGNFQGQHHHFTVRADQDQLPLLQCLVQRYARIPF